MPRFSKKKEEQLLLQLTQSSDIEDDDPLLQPSALNTSSTPPRLSQSPPAADKASTPRSSKTLEEIQELARKDAQNSLDNLLHLKCFPKIAHSSDIKWYRKAPKRNKQRLMLWYPGFIRRDSSDVQLVPMRRWQSCYFEFLGLRLPSKSKIEPVSERQLEDYYYHEGNHDNETPRTWSSSRMDEYLQQLRKSKPFQVKDETDRQHMLLAERYFLSLLLEHVQQSEQSTPTVEESSSSEPPATNQEQSASLSRQDEHTAAPQLAVTESDTTGSPACESPTAISNARLEQQCRRLRAGDIVEYIPPVQVGGPANRATAMVVAAIGKSKGSNKIALELSDGTLLPMDSQVRLMKRFLRGDYMVMEDPLYLPLEEFRLDASYNGKFRAEDFSARSKGLGAILEEEESLMEQAILSSVYRSPDRKRQLFPATVANSKRRR